MIKAHSPKTGNSVAKVFIVDDHPIVRLGLKQLLQTDPQLRVCGEAEGIEDAMTQLDQARPDVMLVDLAMNDESGLDLIRRVHEHWVGIRIIVVSSFDAVTTAPLAFEAGAVGYVNKHEALDHILNAVHCVLCGKRFLADDAQEPCHWFG